MRIDENDEPHVKFEQPLDIRVMTIDGTQILLLGYDDNEQWIRTLVNGSYTDGEYLTLNAANPPTTANYFSSIKGVQFTVTPRNGVVNLVEVEVASDELPRARHAVGALLVDRLRHPGEVRHRRRRKLGHGGSDRADLC